jgi:hypothetical protein
MRRRTVTVTFLFVLVCQPAMGQSGNVERFPWAPEVRCNLNPSNSNGLIPDAYEALKRLTLGHRITQGINHSSDRGNVHDTDVTINGKHFTGAVDISVRCLTEPQIRTLLGRLADAGFAGWFRKPGEDGWTGPPHIHAIWVGCPLKRVLRQQVESWLRGSNGLGTDQPYAFWKPSAEMNRRVAMLYRAVN